MKRKLAGWLLIGLPIIIPSLCVFGLWVWIAGDVKDVLYACTIIVLTITVTVFAIVLAISIVRGIDLLRGGE